MRIKIIKILLKYLDNLDVWNDLLNIVLKRDL